MPKTSGKYTNIAKRIVENSYYDKENSTLFVHEPGISFSTLKSLAKKRGFTVGKVDAGEYVSIPARYKYHDSDSVISLYDDFMSTYARYDGTFDTLLEYYKVFDSMDQNTGEISLILDTYASEVLSQGFIENPLSIKISNQNAQRLVERILYKNKVYQKLPEIIRSLAKYGNMGILIHYPYLDRWLDREENPDFKKIDVLEDLKLTFVNPKYFKVNTDEYYSVLNYETFMPTTFTQTTSVSPINNLLWQPWQFTHFLLPSETTEPYGKSMLWSMRSAYDQLTTLEGLLAISRASNIQRLVFYVPVPPGVSLVDSYGFLNEFKTQYLNSIFTDTNGIKAGRKVPGALSILTMPVAPDGKKVEVETIEAKIDLSSTEDVDYFLDKLLRDSALPKGYLVGDDVITTAQTLEAQDLKLRRTLIPLKKAFVTGMMNLVENILTHANYDVSKLDVEVSLNEPCMVDSSTLEKYKDVAELVKSFAELNPQMTDINKYQAMVQLGIPSNIACLVSATSSINQSCHIEDLAKFLKGQKVKKQSEASSEESMDDLLATEESAKIKLNSKEYFAENYDLSKSLMEFNRVFRTSVSGTADRELKESMLRSKKVSANEEK